MRAPAFDPIYPKSDRETQRFSEDITALLNRPHRNEWTIPVPLIDALVNGRPEYSMVPTVTYGGQTPITVAGASNSSTISPVSYAVNSMRAVAFMVGHAFPAKAIAFKVTTGTATAKARVGIYSSGQDSYGNWEPTDLLLDSGELDASTTGTKRTTFTNGISLEPAHLYYAAYLAYTAQPTITGIPVAGLKQYAESSDGVFNSHLSVAYTGGSGGLPLIFPSGSVVQSSTAPAVYITFGAGQDSGHLAMLTCPAWSPFLDGFYVKRVRIAAAYDFPRSFYGPSFLVRALLSDRNGINEIGRFDTTSGALTANVPRTMSASDSIDKALTAQSTLQVEVTQRGWPKLSVRVCTVFFDIGVS